MYEKSRLLLKKIFQSSYLRVVSDIRAINSRYDFIFHQSFHFYTKIRHWHCRCFHGCLMIDHFYCFDIHKTWFPQLQANLLYLFNTRWKIAKISSWLFEGAFYVIYTRIGSGDVKKNSVGQTVGFGGETVCYNIVVIDGHVVRNPVVGEFLTSFFGAFFMKFDSVQMTTRGDSANKRVAWILC